jgi:hypothetical protein
MKFTTVTLLYLTITSLVGYVISISRNAPKEKIERAIVAGALSIIIYTVLVWSTP